MLPLPPVCADMRAAAYIIALLGAGLWYLTFGQWLAWIFLLGLLSLPLLSLALSMKAILDFQLAPMGPERVAVGEKAELMLMGSCGSPMPPFKGKIRLRNLRTGEKIAYREELGFTPVHCGGYEVTVEKGRVMDYLGLFSFPVRKKQSARILVSPIPVPAEDLPRLLTRPPVRWKASACRLGENYELRPYRPGDSLNSVHWKLSAKTGALTVREAQAPVKQTAAIALTLYGSDQTVDAVLGQLLWLGQLLLERNFLPEIHAAAGSGTVVQRVQDSAALVRAIDALLCLDAPETPAVPDPGLAGIRFLLGGNP